MIFKIQVPVFTTLATPVALIYNEDRSIEVTVEVTDELLEFMDGELKLFAEGRVEDGIFNIDSLAPWQDW